ncbi:hypothetical protein AKO1_000920 [Acrasis kona]|uniref:Uncharacterized protein n=1 Tax=Acrasis kona TaxID=1008807 RepID=A0AAW2ZR45_9EUKA
MTDVADHNYSPTHSPTDTIIPPLRFDNNGHLIPTKSRKNAKTNINGLCDKPLDKLPVSEDLPRLARKIEVSLPTDEDNQTDSSGEDEVGSSSLPRVQSLTKQNNNHGSSGPSSKNSRKVWHFRSSIQMTASKSIFNGAVITELREYINSRPNINLMHGSEFLVKHQGKYIVLVVDVENGNVGLKICFREKIIDLNEGTIEKKYATSNRVANLVKWNDAYDIINLLNDEEYAEEENENLTIFDNVLN